LQLAQVTGTPDAATLTKLLVSVLTGIGLSSAQLERSWVGLASDGAAVLTGQHTGLATRVGQSHAPYVIHIHCWAHRTNLAAKVLDSVGIVTKLRSALQSLSSHFCNSTKRQQQLRACQLSEEVLSNKVLRDVVTR
jgi:hypothetical protein